MWVLRNTAYHGVITDHLIIMRKIFINSFIHLLKLMKTRNNRIFRGKKQEALRKENTARRVTVWARAQTVTLRTEFSHTDAYLKTCMKY